MENHHFSWENPLFHGKITIFNAIYTIAMLNYQRVLRKVLFISWGKWGFNIIVLIEWGFNIILEILDRNIIFRWNFGYYYHWIGLIGKKFTGKPHEFNGKNPWVSGQDFPLNESNDSRGMIFGKRLHNYGKIHHFEEVNQQFRLGYFQ